MTDRDVTLEIRGISFISVKKGPKRAYPHNASVDGRKVTFAVEHHKYAESRTVSADSVRNALRRAVNNSGGHAKVVGTNGQVAVYTSPDAEVMPSGCCERGVWTESGKLVTWGDMKDALGVMLRDAEVDRVTRDGQTRSYSAASTVAYAMDLVRRYAKVHGG